MKCQQRSAWTDKCQILTINRNFRRLVVTVHVRVALKLVASVTLSKLRSGDEQLWRMSRGIHLEQTTRKQRDSDHARRSVSLSFSLVHNHRGQRSTVTGVLYSFRNLMLDTFQTPSVARLRQLHDDMRLLICVCDQPV